MSAMTGSVGKPHGHRGFAHFHQLLRVLRVGFDRTDKPAYLVHKLHAGLQVASLHFGLWNEVSSSHLLPFLRALLD